MTNLTGRQSTLGQSSIGASLSARLFSAERAIDLALAEAAGLMTMLPGARTDAYLSAVTGQKAFDGTAASIAALTEARSHMVSTHNTLAALARKLGLEALAVGPLDKPEDDHGVGQSPEIHQPERTIVSP
ncbi:hypothetical protein BH10PSE2_BH10PSE2_11460 [soil metagenome]